MFSLRRNFMLFGVLERPQSIWRALDRFKLGFAYFKFGVDRNYLKITKVLKFLAYEFFNFR